MQRRQFVQLTAGLSAGLFAEGMTAGDEPGTRPPTSGPDEVLQWLLDGNERFRSGQARHPRASEARLKQLTAGQRPVATILSCSDSRVPLELLFDVGFGDLFVIRVAGNVVTRYGIGSMEYAQHHLRTPLFMVLGHEGCGAVTAAMLPEAERNEEPKGVRELLDLVHVGEVDPSATAKQRLDSAVAANVRNSSKQLRELDPMSEGFSVRAGEVLVSAVYDLSTGRVRVLGKHYSSAAE